MASVDEFYALWGGRALLSLAVVFTVILLRVWLRKKYAKLKVIVLDATSTLNGKVNVRAKFAPRGEINLSQHTLNIGAESYKADRLPIKNLDKEGIYIIPFSVPYQKVLAQKKSDITYMVTSHNAGDCRSKNNFGIDIVSS